MAMLEMHSIDKTWQTGTVALDDVSLNVSAGEFVVVLGRSGSGKSTLLRTINRLVEPTRGRVVVNGEECTGAPENRLRKIRRKIGMVFQEFHLINRASVLTNVLSGGLGYTSPWSAWLNRFSKADTVQAFTHLERLGLYEKWDQRADRLSGGQRQRVAIARALMQEPSLLLADEPVASLDPSASKTIMDTLADINSRLGVTVICNLHLPDLAREYARRIVCLDAGRVRFDGPPSDLTASTLSRLYGEDGDN